MVSTVITQIETAGENNIYIKRDDLIPVSFGGNKARKALKYFEEIDKGEYRSIVTYGSSSSNHCRIISNMAAARGMYCIIISPQEVSNPTFNSQMMKLFGAEIIVVPTKYVHETIEQEIEKLKKEGKNPYFIPGGGHGNLGTQAYVDCYDEIITYENMNSIHFDYIFLASGTGTTQAGLICGQLIHKDSRKIVGISIARENPRGRKIVLESVYDYLKEKKYFFSQEKVEQETVFLDDYIEQGYGKDNCEIRETIMEVLIRFGIPMDVTYTAKAFTGMKKYLSYNNITNKNILFIHTGGTPLFFDYLREVK